MVIEKYYSQIGQDMFVDQYFRKLRGGVFVEAGAHDGITYSNTFFLERERGWTGLCVEPHQDTFDELRVNRSCAVENVAIGSETKTVDFIKVTAGCSGCSALRDAMDFERLKLFTDIHGGEWSETVVQQVRTQDLLDKHGLREIDYFSLDTDGNEEDALAGIDWSRTVIRLMTVENTSDDRRMRDVMSGYRMEFVCRLQWDDVYKRK